MVKSSCRSHRIECGVCLCYAILPFTKDDSDGVVNVAGVVLWHSHTYRRAMFLFFSSSFFTINDDGPLS